VVQVFLDKRRLQDGQDFREDFAHALIESYIAFPVIDAPPIYARLLAG
jgi:hypothetical protein